MRTIHFNCYKVAASLPLNKIASFFNIHTSWNRKGFIFLDHRHIDRVLKYKTQKKEIFLFDFGCITFVNFKDSEMHTFIGYLESITGSMDYSLFAKFNKDHRIKVFDDKCDLGLGSEELFGFDNQIITIISTILAKSVALYKVEVDSDMLLDEAENFIIWLHHGQLRTDRNFIGIITRILRFEYESINSIGIFDRPVWKRESSVFNGIYDSFVEYYELHDRFNIVQSKINNLLNITKSYSELSHKQVENRLYLLEVFLLALFPLVSLSNHIFGSHSVAKLFGFFK